MQLSSARVLVADRDRPSRRQLRHHIESEGLTIIEASDSHRLLAELARQLPHLILMDIQLVPTGGLELCRQIKRYGDLPIMVRTALEDEETKLKALDLYAEDYIAKSVSYPEVAARVRRVLLRTWFICLPGGPSICVDGQVKLDFLRREVRTPCGVSHLTPTESRLLQLLIRNAGQVLPSALLLERLWGDAESCQSSLWEYVRRVRHKLGDDGARPRYILNEPGLGYSFSSTVPITTSGR